MDSSGKMLINHFYRYIGSDKAIADLPFLNGNVSFFYVWIPSFIVILTKKNYSHLIATSQFATGGVATFLFWRSAYLSTLFSLRNRTLVATDWLKVKLFGRYVQIKTFSPFCNADYDYLSTFSEMSVESERRFLESQPIDLY